MSTDEQQALTARTGLNLAIAKQPQRLDSRLVEHQIAVDDEERQFEHENRWQSCCLTMDKRAVSYLGQLFISVGVAAFSVAMMATHPDDCATFSRYSPLLTLIVGVWLPQPTMAKNDRK